VKHIGLDFDDTLVDMRKSIVQILNKLHREDLIFEEIKEYGVSDLYGYTFEEFIEFFTENQKDLHNISPFPFLLEVLTGLRHNSKLSIMTSRPPEWMESASNWVKDNNLPIDEIMCASIFKNGKAECASIHNVSLFIEDNPEHALALANSDIRVLLLDKPYNRDCKHSLITRVKDWEEIGRLLLS
jgi:uncharacterized HAD superfamily protein